MIWMFDKREHRYIFAPIKKVAQEPKYYSDEDERRLNDLVERPANPVLKQIRDGRPIDSEHHVTLATYAATMLTRGPKQREKRAQLLPDAARTTLARIEALLHDWARTSEDREQVATRLDEFERIKSEVMRDPGRVLEHLVRSPWPTEFMQTVISEMTWVIGRSDGQDRFITSDTPVWYDTGRGMNKVDSEMVLPLSSRTALFASWQGRSHETRYVRIRPAIVREVNRRAMSSAVRFAYADSAYAWIRQLAKKPCLRLNRIEFDPPIHQPEHWKRVAELMSRRLVG